MAISASSGTDLPATYSFWYSSTGVGRQHNYLTIDDAGNVTAQICDSQPGSAPRPLGWYYFSPGHGDAELAALGRLIRTDAVTNYSSAAKPPVRGMRTKVFSIQLDGKQSVYVFNSVEPLPAAFGAIEQAALKLFERAQPTPLRTLSLEVGLGSDSAEPGGMVRVDLTFRAAGKFPTEFRNPATFKPEGTDSLRINLWRSVKDESGSPDNEFETTVDLAGHEFLVATRKAVSSSEPLLRLKPGETLHMWTTIRLPKLKADTYDVETIYLSDQPPPEEHQKKPDLIAGEYHADSRKLIVRRK